MKKQIAFQIAAIAGGLGLMYMSLKNDVSSAKTEKGKATDKIIKNSSILALVIGGIGWMTTPSK